jgi:hypothetical protein
MRLRMEDKERSRGENPKIDHELNDNPMRAALLRFISFEA